MLPSTLLMSTRLLAQGCPANKNIPRYELRSEVMENAESLEEFGSELQIQVTRRK